MWVADESGRYRGREYFDKLRVPDKAKLQALIERECDIQLGIRDVTKFRNEQDGIWAFKAHQHRLFCFFHYERVCITHGVRKKQDKVLPSELKIAKRIRESYLAKGTNT